MTETITQTKICSKCKVEKTFDMFSKRTTSKDGYRSQCKQCEKEYQQINKNKIKEYQKLYRQDNSEIIKEKSKIYFKKRYAKDKMNMIEYSKKYYNENKDKKAEYYKKYIRTMNGKSSKKNSFHKRRTILKKGDVSNSELLKLEINAKVCYWCGISFRNTKVHIDHYIPLSKGGEHTISNLVVSCQKCNCSKQAKDPVKFAQSLGKLF